MSFYLVFVGAQDNEGAGGMEDFHSIHASWGDAIRVARNYIEEAVADWANVAEINPDGSMRWWSNGPRGLEDDIEFDPDNWQEMNMHPGSLRSKPPAPPRRPTMTDPTAVYYDLWASARQCPQCLSDLDSVLLIGAASNGIAIQYTCPHCGAAGTRPVTVAVDPLAALREARALVEALLEYGKPWRAQNEYPDYGGPDTYCPVCKHETWGDFDAGLHAPDCGLMAAWNALARWRGDKPAEEEK